MQLPVRAVLFDLDDTLFDHAHATRHALGGLQARAPALECWTLDELERRHAEILEAMHEQVLAGRMSIEAAREERFRRLLIAAAAHAERCATPADLARCYRTGYELAWRPVPGAVELLTAIKSAGLSVAVVTNNLTAEQELKLARCGLASFVDHLVTSEEVGATKPDPRIFDAALDRLGVEASTAVMLGDIWPTDIVGARAAGLRAVWFNWTGASSPDPTVSEVRALEPLDEVWRALVSNGVS